jgi:hypothetical protein
MTLCGQRVPYVAFRAPRTMAIVNVVGRNRVVAYNVQGIRLNLRQELRIGFSIRPRHGGAGRGCRLPARLPVSMPSSPSALQHQGSEHTLSASTAFHWAVNQLPRQSRRGRNEDGLPPPGG